MPQSSRVMVTFCARCCQRATSLFCAGDAVAVWANANAATMATINFFIDAPVVCDVIGSIYPTLKVRTVGEAWNIYRLTRGREMQKANIQLSQAQPRHLGSDTTHVNGCHAPMS